MFWKTKKPHYPLVVDIGSRSVKVLTYTYDEKAGNIMITGVGISPLSKEAIEHGLIRDTRVLAKSLESAYLEAKQTETEVTMVLGTSGILTDTTVSSIDHHRKNPEKPIRQKEWQEILGQAACRVQEEEYHSQLAHNMPMELIQSTMENIKLDGTLVDDDILGKTGEHIDVRVFNAYIPKQITSELCSLAESSQVPIEGIFNTSYAVTRLIVDNHNQSNLNMVLIDVGQSHTDVSVVIDGQIQDIQSFSIGGDSFTHTLVQAFEATEDEIENLKKEYSKAQLPRKLSEKITSLLTNDITLWLNGISACLSRYPSDVTLPEYFVLFGGSAGLIGVKEALEYGQWHKHLSLQGKPKVSIFTPKSLPHIVDLTDKINHPKFIPLIGLIHVSATLQNENAFAYKKI